MRAAYDREREGLARAAEQAGGALCAVFVYNGTGEAKPARFGFECVREDMSSICRKICAAAGKERR